MKEKCFARSSSEEQLLRREVIVFDRNRQVFKHTFFRGFEIVSSPVKGKIPKL